MSSSAPATHKNCRKNWSHQQNMLHHLQLNTYQSALAQFLLIVCSFHQRNAWFQKIDSSFLAQYHWKNQGRRQNMIPIILGHSRGCPRKCTADFKIYFSYVLQRTAWLVWQCFNGEYSKLRRRALFLRTISVLGWIAGFKLRRAKQVYIRYALPFCSICCSSWGEGTIDSSFDNFRERRQYEKQKLDFSAWT